MKDDIKTYKYRPNCGDKLKAPTVQPLKRYMTAKRKEAA